MMKLFIGWINQKLNDREYDKIKLATESHVLFETIHPFRDGNGRVGRILLSYILIGCGYVNIAIKGTTSEQRNRYYDALETADDNCEKLLRKVENSAKIKTRDIDNCFNISNITKIQQIIDERLRFAVEQLKSKALVTHDQEAVLPLRDIAKYYNYSQDYLRNLINNKKLPARKQGKLWYVKVRDIENYMKHLQD